MKSFILTLGVIYLVLSVTQATDKDENECHSTYHRRCEEIPIIKCENKTEVKCRKVPKQECKTVYEDKCTTVKENACNTVSVCKCSPKYGYNNKHVIYKPYNGNCQSDTEYTCIHDYQEACKKVPRTVCKQIPKKECRTVYTDVYSNVKVLHCVTVTECQCKQSGTVSESEHAITKYDSSGDDDEHNDDDKHADIDEEDDSEHDDEDKYECDN